MDLKRIEPTAGAQSPRNITGNEGINGNKGLDENPSDQSKQTDKSVIDTANVDSEPCINTKRARG